MKSKVVYIERKPSESVSLEKVFRQIAKSLSTTKFETAFEQLPYFSRVSGIIKNFIYFQKPSADIYHITGDIHYIALLLPREKTVLTIHDLRFLHVRRGLRRYVLKKLFLDFPLKRLKYITAISEATKKEIIFYTKCAADKIRVIENPLHETIFINESNKFNEYCPTILQIGTAANKNLANLIKALRGIKCRLKIIGQLESEIVELLKTNQIYYENACGLNDYSIRREYEKADIVVFCSTYEGFGLPIIESQAMQTPVITSNLSPMKEVAGDAAILVEPSDISSIREGVLQIINNELLRNKLIEQGLINIKRFEPSQIAKKYESIYQEIISQKK